MWSSALAFSLPHPLQVLSKIAFCCLGSLVLGLLWSGLFVGITGGAVAHTLWYMAARAQAVCWQVTWAIGLCASINFLIYCCQACPFNQPVLTWRQLIWFFCGQRQYGYYGWWHLEEHIEFEEQVLVLWVPMWVPVPGCSPCLAGVCHTTEFHLVLCDFSEELSQRPLKD